MDRTKRRNGTLAGHADDLLRLRAAASASLLRHKHWNRPGYTHGLHRERVDGDNATAGLQSCGMGLY